MPWVDEYYGFSLPDSRPPYKQMTHKFYFLSPTLAEQSTILYQYWKGKILRSSRQYIHIYIYIYNIYILSLNVVVSNVAMDITHFYMFSLNLSLATL